MPKAAAAVQAAPAPAPAPSPPGDVVTVRVSGFATISGEARVAFDTAMRKFGERLYSEADLLESDHRDTTSDVPQFTSSMIAKAEGHAREIEYITLPLPPRPKWRPWAEFGHWFFTALAGISAGIAVTKEAVISQSFWWAICLIAVVFGGALSIAVNSSRRKTK